jgi:hypothetical protein
MEVYQKIMEFDAVSGSFLIEKSDCIGTIGVSEI